MNLRGRCGPLNAMQSIKSRTAWDLCVVARNERGEVAHVLYVRLIASLFFLAARGGARAAGFVGQLLDVI